MTLDPQREAPATLRRAATRASSATVNSATLPGSGMPNTNSASRPIKACTTALGCKMSENAECARLSTGKGVIVATVNKRCSSKRSARFSKFGAGAMSKIPTPNRLELPRLHGQFKGS